MPAIVDVFRFFAGAARCLPGMAAGEYLEGHTSMIRRDPVGVVASIAPWNYPLMMAARSWPRRWRQLRSDKTLGDHPADGAEAGGLAKDIFPEGVINVLFGRGKRWATP